MSSYKGHDNGPSTGWLTINRFLLESNREGPARYVAVDTLDTSRPSDYRHYLSVMAESILTDTSADRDPETGRAQQRGEIRTQIADGLVALFKEYYGRGPDQARAYYVDDIVVFVMRGGFTRVEQTLLDGGQREIVVEQRMMFQEVMADRFKTLVHEVTGRPVVGFISGNQPDPEMTCEVFVLGSHGADSNGS